MIVVSRGWLGIREMAHASDPSVLVGQSVPGNAGDTGRGITGGHLTRLKKAFDELDTITVRGCINKANKHLDELREHIVQQEDNDEASGI